MSSSGAWRYLQYRSQSGGGDVTGSKVLISRVVPPLPLGRHSHPRSEHPSAIRAHRCSALIHLLFGINVVVALRVL